MTRLRSVLRVSRIVTVLIGGSFLLFACTDAGGSAQGGDPKFDATPPELPPQVATDAGGDSGIGTGITFTDLYRDYFGRETPGPGCSGDGACHGDATKAGAMGSGGYVCPAGDKNACYAGITGMAALVNPAKDKAAPMNSYLIDTLRHASNGVTLGTMPKRPATFVFSDADIKRISDWIAAGAANN